MEGEEAVGRVAADRRSLRATSAGVRTCLGFVCLFSRSHGGHRTEHIAQGPAWAFPVIARGHADAVLVVHPFPHLHLHLRRS